jgi:hypothetical protein
MDLPHEEASASLPNVPAMDFKATIEGYQTATLRMEGQYHLRCIENAL